MKQLTLLFLLIPVLGFSQIIVSTEIDPRNAIFGSPTNEPAYDGVFNLGFRSEGFHVQASYENFKAIDFYSFGFKAGHVFNHEKDLQFTLLGGLSWIQRNVDWMQKVLFISASISGQLEYHLGRIFFTARSEIRQRGDLDKQVFSGYVGIGIKI